MLYNYLDLDIYNIFRYLHKMHHIAQFTDLECQERQQIGFSLLHNIEELVYDVMRVKTQQLMSFYKTAIISCKDLYYEPIDIILFSIINIFQLIWTYINISTYYLHRIHVLFIKKKYFGNLYIQYLYSYALNIIFIFSLKLQQFEYISVTTGKCLIRRHSSFEPFNVSYELSTLHSSVKGWRL